MLQHGRVEHRVFTIYVVVMADDYPNYEVRPRCALYCDALKNMSPSTV